MLPSAFQDSLRQTLQGLQALHFKALHLFCQVELPAVIRFMTVYPFQTLVMDPNGYWHSNKAGMVSLHCLWESTSHSPVTLLEIQTLSALLARGWNSLPPGILQTMECMEMPGFTLKTRHMC